MVLSFFRSVVDLFLDRWTYPNDLIKLDNHPFVLSTEMFWLRFMGSFSPNSKGGSHWERAMWRCYLINLRFPFDIESITHRCLTSQRLRLISNRYNANLIMSPRKGTPVPALEKD